MRIRSIKYKSAGKTESHYQLPSRGLIYSKPQTISTDNLLACGITNKVSSKNLLAPKFYKTHQTNFQSLSFHQNQPFEMKKNSFFVSTQDKSAKGRTFYEKDKKLGYDKENKSSYLRLKTNVSNRGQQGFTLKWREDAKTQKGGPKIDNYNSKVQSLSQQQQQKTQQIQKKHQEASMTQSDEIIKGENLTYGIETLQKDISQVQQEIRKEKVKIDKIRGQMELIRPRVQREIDNIVREFRKGADGLWARLSKEKAQKCTELVNWKGVIEAKVNEYAGQFEFINSIDQQFSKLSYVVGLKMSCSSQDQTNRLQ